MKITFPFLFLILSISWASSPAQSLSKTALYEKVVNKENSRTIRLESAKTLYNQLSLEQQDTLYPLVSLQLSTLMRSIGNTEEALSYAENCIRYGTLFKDTLNILKGKYHKGYTLHILRKPTDAIVLYNEALEHAANIRDTVYILRLTNAKSDILVSLGDYALSQEIVTNALQIANPTKHAKHIITLNQSLGTSLINQEAYDEAIDVLDRAIIMSSTDARKYTLLNNKANALRKNEQYLAAIETYTKAIILEKDEKVTKSSARLRDNLGYTYYESGEHQKGLPLMLQAIEQRKNLNDNEGLNASYIHLIKAYLNKDDTKALQYALEGYKNSLILKSPDAQQEILSYLTRLSPNKKLASRYAFLNDSLKKANLKRQNMYAGIKYLADEKEKENLKLKTLDVEQELKLATQSRNNWILGAFLCIALVGLLLYGYYYRRNKRQRTIIETLHKEMHHRVTNNLAIISQFIHVAREETKDATAIKTLSGLESRVSSIGQVHAQLYQQEDMKEVNVKAYLQLICGHLQSSLSAQHIQINIDIPESLTLPSNITFPLGLVVNEFLTNSIKHAFGNTEEGIIGIRFRESEKKHIFTLSDNGPGIDEALLNVKTKSYGLKMIRLLTMQMNGTIGFLNANGLHLTLEIPSL